MQILIVLYICYSMVAMVLTSNSDTNSLTPNTNAEDSLSNTTSTDMENDNDSIFKDKHELLQQCSIYSAEYGEYVLFKNGTINVTDFNVTLNESLYVLINGTVNFCNSFLSKLTENDTKNSTFKKKHKEYVHKISYIWIFSLIGLGISVVSLLIHLIVFVIVPDLKNLPGCNLAALCASLFCSYFFLFLIGTGVVLPYQELCIATAFLTHFFFLSSFLWMSIMSYDVFMSLLRATGSFRASSTHFNFKRFGIYCLCSFGVALLVAVASLLADTLDGFPEQFKPKYNKLCWFTNKTSLSIFFVGPTIVLSCLNFVLFGISAFILHFNKMNTHKGTLTKNTRDRKSIFRRRYLMYFRLSVIMGITWIVGVVANIANVAWLWFTFSLLNTFQGFFIFIAFTCSKKVKKYFREKYFSTRRASEQSITPTFISYCSYDNSVDKHMDTIVESCVDKTDTDSVQL